MKSCQADSQWHRRISCETGQRGSSDSTLRREAPASSRRRLAGVTLELAASTAKTARRASGVSPMVLCSVVLRAFVREPVKENQNRPAYTGRSPWMRRVVRRISAEPTAVPIVAVTSQLVGRPADWMSVGFVRGPSPRRPAAFDSGPPTSKSELWIACSSMPGRALPQRTQSQPSTRPRPCWGPAARSADDRWRRGGTGRTECSTAARPASPTSSYVRPIAGSRGRKTPRTPPARRPASTTSNGARRR